MISTSGVNRTRPAGGAQAGRDVELLRVEREALRRTRPPRRTRVRGSSMQAPLTQSTSRSVARSQPSMLVPAGERVVAAHQRDERVSDRVDHAREPPPARVDGAVGVADHRPDDAGARVWRGRRQRGPRACRGTTRCRGSGTADTARRSAAAPWFQAGERYRFVVVADQADTGHGRRWPPRRSPSRESLSIDEHVDGEVAAARPQATAGTGRASPRC